MTEKKFLNCVLTEGVLLTILGIAMLVLPKLTTITFGMMICLSFIVYGGYKIINAFMAKHYTRHFVLNILLGLILAGVGFFLFIAPMFNLLLITSVIGVYFLLESISTSAFAVQNRKTLYFWWVDIPVAVVQFFVGLLIIIGLPSTFISGFPSNLDEPYLAGIIIAVLVIFSSF